MKVSRYLIIGLLFAVLVSFGVTFCSVGFMQNDSVVSLIGERKLIGSYQPVRSDEFEAHGLLPAVQQTTASPKFPRVNHRVGLSGRNYLLLHDTGAPVRHVSMIARPSVWGFFFLDLRRALSWMSLFPVFFSILAFLFLFDTLWHDGEWVHLLAAVACVFTLNSSVWSFWSAYNVAGMAIAMASVIRMARTDRRLAVAGWSLLMGWGLSVSALTVYYPRILYGAILLGFVFVGWCVQEGAWRKLLSPVRLAGIIIGTLLCGIIILSWLNGVGDDIELMKNSAYPGLRRDYGGNYNLSQVFLGWLSPLLVNRPYFGNGVSNVCEIQEPMFIMSALVAYLVLSCKKLKTRAIVWAGVLYGCFLYALCYVGLPKWFMGISMLDRGNHSRADYFFSLMQIFVLLAIYSASEGRNLISLRDLLQRRWKAVAVLVVIVLPVFTLCYIPEEILAGMLAVRRMIKWLFWSSLMVAAYFMFSVGFFIKFRWVICAFCCFEIFWGLLFNPICIAPVRFESPLLAAVSTDCHNWRHGGRVLFANCHGAVPNLYAAAGGKTLSGFFEYYDPVLTDLLFGGFPDKDQFKRLNHLQAEVKPEADKLFSATLPYADSIKVTFDGRRYPFSRLPVDYLVSEGEDSVAALRENPSVEYMCKFGNRTCFRVKGF